MKANNPEYQQSLQSAFNEADEMCRQFSLDDPVHFPLINGRLAISGAAHFFYGQDLPDLANKVREAATEKPAVYCRLVSPLELEDVREAAFGKTDETDALVVRQGRHRIDMVFGLSYTDVDSYDVGATHEILEQKLIRLIKEQQAIWQVERRSPLAKLLGRLTSRPGSQPADEV